MNEPTALTVTTTTVQTIDADTIFSALNDRSRRQVLGSLFDGEFHSVAGMGGTLPKNRDLLRKHCAVLVKAETTPTGRTLDFGCCIVRC